MLNTYKHESGLAPIEPFDRLQPTTRQFTGTPHVHRAYVLNKTSGKIVEACGHRHRTAKAAQSCANEMMNAASNRSSAPLCGTTGYRASRRTSGHG